MVGVLGSPRRVGGWVGGSFRTWMRFFGGGPFFQQSNLFLKYQPPTGTSGVPLAEAVMTTTTTTTT